MITIGNLLNGVKISFETRGVDDETADFLWNQLSPSKIKQFTEETGHNLVVYDKKGEQVAITLLLCKPLFELLFENCSIFK